MKPEIQKLIEENEELVEKNLYRWIAGYKRRKHEFTIPTDEEILGYFAESGYHANQDTVKKIRSYYEGKKEGKWIDSYGNEVANWKGKLRQVWFKNAIPLVKQNNLDKF